MEIVAPHQYAQHVAQLVKLVLVQMLMTVRVVILEDSFKIMVNVFYHVQGPFGEILQIYYVQLVILIVLDV